jgi:hypothetical protein
LTSIPYVVPFVVFLVFLTLSKWVGLPPLTEQLLWFAGMAAVIVLVARPALDFRVRRWPGTVALGVGTFRRTFAEPAVPVPRAFSLR